MKFDIKDINSTACVDPGKGIREVAQVAMMGFREVLIAGGYVNKVQHIHYGNAFRRVSDRCAQTRVFCCGRNIARGVKQLGARVRGLRSLSVAQ